MAPGSTTPSSAAGKIGCRRSRSKPVSQSRERCDLVETAIRFPLVEDEPPIGLAEVGERDAIRECPPLLGMEALQQRNCREKRIVATRRAEREDLKERTGVFVDRRILLGRDGQRRCLVVLNHRLEFRASCPAAGASRLSGREPLQAFPKFDARPPIAYIESWRRLIADTGSSETRPLCRTMRSARWKNCAFSVVGFEHSRVLRSGVSAVCWKAQRRQRGHLMFASLVNRLHQFAISRLRLLHETIEQAGHSLERYRMPDTGYSHIGGR